MWPAEDARRGQLLLVVGTRRIEGGLVIRRGLSGRALEARLGADIRSSGAPLEGAVESLQALTRGPLPQAWKAAACLRVVLADGWIAAAELPWTPQVMFAARAEAYGRAQLQAAGFDLAADDVLRLDDAACEQPRLAVAYPAALMAALQALASALSVKLESVLPLSVVAWHVTRRRWRGRLSVLAVTEGDGWLSFARCGPGRGARLGALTLRRASGGGQVPALHTLQQCWRRMCLRDASLDQVKQVALLECSTDVRVDEAVAPFVRVDPAAGRRAAGVPAALDLVMRAGPLRHAADAMPPPAVGGAWAWSVVALMVLLVAGLAGQGVQRALAVGRLMQQAESAPQRMPPVTSPMNWTRDDDARARSVNAAIRELNLPIHALLEAVSPPDGMRVAVLHVETRRDAGDAGDAQSPGLRIAAHAANGNEMTRYAAYVARQAPFIGAYLMRHEIDPAASGLPYRFTLEATWRP